MIIDVIVCRPDGTQETEEREASADCKRSMSGRMDMKSTI